MGDAMANDIMLEITKDVWIRPSMVAFMKPETEDITLLVTSYGHAVEIPIGLLDAQKLLGISGISIGEQSRERTEASKK